MENTNTNIPTDPFEFFLALDDVNGKEALSPKTREILANEAVEYNETRNSNISDEAFDFLEPDESELEADLFGDNFTIDKDFLFEDEQPESEDDTQPEKSEGEEGVEFTDGDDIDQETLDEAYDVDFDTVITLPNGEITTIEELTKFAKTGEELANKEAAIAKREADVEARLASSQSLLDVSTLELDRLLSDYDGFDWDTLGATDPQAYFEHQKYVKSLTDKRQQVINERARIEANEAKRKQDEFSRDATHCVKTLKAEIPEWSDPYYETLTDYIIAKGGDADKVLVNVDPLFWKLVHENYKLTSGVNAVKAKLEKVKGKGMRKVLQPNAGQPMTGRKEAEQAQAAAMYAKGQMSNADAFKFLED